jgi:hypothetical protein
MILIGKILNSDATLNNHCVINTLEFIPGSTFTIFFQIFKKQCDEELRYMAVASNDDPSDLVVTVNLPKKDGTDLSIVATQMENDASIWSVEVSAAQSSDLADGNIQFTVVDTGSSPSTLKGWIKDGLSLVITGDIP